MMGRSVEVRYRTEYTEWATYNLIKSLCGTEASWSGPNDQDID